MGKNCAELTSFQIWRGVNQFMSEVEWHLLVDGLLFSWLKLQENCFNNHGLKLEANKQNGLQGLQLQNLGSEPNSSEVSWVKCPSPSVSDPMELTSWWSHALHRWIPTSYLQVVPLDGCGFPRSPLGEVMQEFLGVDPRVGKMEATRKVMSDHLSHWGMDFNIWHA